MKFNFVQSSYKVDVAFTPQTSFTFLLQVSLQVTTPE